MALKIKVIHGPNLNLLGTREPAIYGHTTLDQINKRLKERAKEKNVAIEIFQSNHEGQIIDYIQAAGDCDGFIINPAAFTHTSIAIRDALVAMNKPFVEVHLSDIRKREDFRKRSFFSDKAIAVVMGKGAAGYDEAFDVLVGHLTK